MDVREVLQALDRLTETITPGTPRNRLANLIVNSKRDHAQRERPEK